MVGRSPRADSDRPRITHAPPPTAADTFDATAVWQAQLVTPTSAVRRDSAQHLAVTVGAPLELSNQTVQIGLEDRDKRVRWGVAAWAGPPGRTRTAAITLGVGALAMPAGLYRVLVRVQAGDLAPVLDAGAVTVT